MQEQQTHSLSRAERELDICARRMGLGSAAELESELEKRRDRVHGVWSGLFERRPGARDYRSRQWFRVLADEASPEEAEALLAEHGLGDAEAALAAVRALDEATALAPSRSMARNVLANLLPALLDRIGRCARPAQVLIRLEQLTERTGAAAAFFRTLLEDEPLRDRLIATLDLRRAGGVAAGALSGAARLADAAAARPAGLARALAGDAGAGRPGEPGRRDPPLQGRRRAQDPGPVDRRPRGG